MALNFPPNPSEGQTHFDPSNGVTYTYKNGGWVASGGTQDDLDLRYVLVAGDNMTGSLTLGTNKIELNADGSIVTAGTVSVGTIQSPTPLTVLGPTNGEVATFYGNGGDLDRKFVISNSNNDNDWDFNVPRAGQSDLSFSTGSVKRLVVDKSGDIKIGGTLPSSPNITLNADGTAEFKDEVKIARSATSDKTVLDVGGWTTTVFPDLYFSPTAGTEQVICAFRNFGNNGLTLLIREWAINSPVNGGRYYKFSINSRGSGATVQSVIVEQLEESSGMSSTRPVEGIFKYKVENSNVVITFTPSSTSGSTHTFQCIVQGPGIAVEDISNVTNGGTTEVSYGTKKADNVLIGGTLPSSPNITLNADGSAEFASEVFIGEQQGGSSVVLYDANETSIFRKDYPTFTDGDRGSFDNNTSLIVRNNDKTNIVSGSFICINNIGNSGYLTSWYLGSKSEVDNATNDDTKGSSFKISQLTKNRDSTVTDRLIIERTGQVFIPSDTRIGGLSSSPNITLNADGSAAFGSTITFTSSGTGIFSSNVYAGGNAFNGTATGVRIISDGSVNASAGSSSAIWRGYTTGTTTPTSLIQANGSAEFAGSITAVYDSQSTVTWLNVSTQSQPWSFLSTDVNGTQIYAGITPDGSAEFAGDIVVGDSPTLTSNTTGIRLESGTLDEGGKLLIATANGTYDCLQIKSRTNPPSCTIDSKGSAQFAGSVSIGGTDAANTIDEYEEGTFTPAITFGGNSVGMIYSSYNRGWYTKIGRIVVLKMALVVTAKGTSTGVAQISVPFASSLTSSSHAQMLGYSKVAAGDGLMMYGSGSDSKFYLEGAVSSTLNGSTRLTESDFGDSFSIYASITYMV